MSGSYRDERQQGNRDRDNGYSHREERRINNNGPRHENRYEGRGQNQGSEESYGNSRYIKGPPNHHHQGRGGSGFREGHQRRQHLEDRYQGVPPGEPGDRSYQGIGRDDRYQGIGRDDRYQGIGRDDRYEGGRQPPGRMEDNRSYGRGGQPPRNERSFSGLGRRGRGGSGGGRFPDKSPRQNDEKHQYITNMFPIEYMDLSELSYMCITTECDGLKFNSIRGINNLNTKNCVKGIKNIEWEVNKALEKRFGFGMFTFDGSANVILPKGTVAESFVHTVKLGRDDTAQEVKIRINSLDKKLVPTTIVEFESRMNSLYKHMAAKVVEKMGGKMDKNNAHPLPVDRGNHKKDSVEERFASIYRRIVGGASDKFANDARTLQPFTVGRGFDSRVIVMGKAQEESIDEKKQTVEEDLISGALQAFLQVQIKIGVFLPEDTKATIFIDKLRSGLCSNYKRDDRKTYADIDKIIKGLHCYRSYDKNENSKTEVALGVAAKKADDIKVDLPDRSVSMVEYFAIKGINIDCRLHPIVIRGRGKNSYLPQDLTMFPSQFISSFDSPIQGKTTNLSRTKPNDYRSLITAYSKLIHEHEAGITFKNVWGMGLKSDEPLFVDGFESKDPSVVYGHGKTASVAKGTWNLRGLQLNITGNKIGNFICLDLNNTDNRDMNTFLQAFSDTHAKLGWESKFQVDSINTPRGPIDERFRAEMIDFVQRTPNDVTGIYVILPQNPTQGDEIYKVVKSEFDGTGLPSQCMKPSKTPILNKKDAPRGPDQHFSNVICGMSIKTLNLNQTLKKADWERLGIEADSSTMILGIDLQHSRKTGSDGRLSTIAMVGTIDETFSQTVSVGQVQEYENDLMKPHLVTVMINNLLKQRADRGVSTPVKHMIILRDGLDVGSYDEMLRKEVKAIDDALKDRGYEANISTLVILKKHGIRLFPKDGDDESNIAPGTCANVNLIGDTDDLGYQRIAKVPHFYVMMHHAIPGSTAVPARVALIKNPTGILASTWASLFYYWAHLDAVVQKTVSLPHTTLFAHKACERVGHLVDELANLGVRNLETINLKLVDKMEMLPNSGFL